MASQQVRIQGLKGWQCASLAGIKKGDLLEVAVFSVPKRLDAEGASGDGGQQLADEDEANDGDDEDSVGENPGAEQSSELEEPDTPQDAEPTESNATKQLADGIEGTVPTVSDEELTARLQEGGTPGGGGANLLVDVAAGSEHPVDPPPTYLAVEREDEAAAGISEEDGSDDDLEEGEIREEDEDDESGDEGEEGEEKGEELPRDLYAVLSVIKDNGDNNVITNVVLRELVYQDPGEDAIFDNYRVYGNTIVLHDPSATAVDEQMESLKDIATSDSNTEVTVLLNPSGAHVRAIHLGPSCPGQCNRGWLADLPALSDVISDNLDAYRPFRPLCPVCLGRDLLDEQLLLRSLLDSMHVVDLGLVVEFLGRLNPARRRLGYPFVQFDEREWGYGFEDMLDESGSEDGDQDGGGFEQWGEAMDPNANPKTRPAGEDVIAALPRKRYEDVGRKEEDAFCAICQGDAFEKGSVVVELACGHVYDEGCLVAWVREYDNCPHCRATVSGMVELEEKGVEGKSKGVAAVDGTGDVEEEAEEANDAELEMDGQDVVMRDAADGW